jgi:hypothetical protein
VPGFVNEAEERDVPAVLATFEPHPYVLHDTPSRRLVRSFGLALVAGAYDAGPAAPIPAVPCGMLRPAHRQADHHDERRPGRSGVSPIWFRPEPGRSC